MALPLIPDTIQIAINGILPDAKPWTNTFYYDDGATVLTQARADALCGVLAVAYGHLAPRWHVAMQVTDALLTDRRTAGGPQFASTAGLGFAGGLSGDPLPPQVNALVSWYTDFRGKAGRGRTYLGGFTEADSFNQAVGATLLTALGDFGDEIIDNTFFVVASQFLGVEIATSGSRRLKPIPRAVAETHPITSRQVRADWATQRRRAPRP